MRVLFSSVNLITFFFFHLVSSHPNEEQVFHFYNEILSHLQATLIDIAQNTPSISSKCRSELIDAFSAEDKLYLTKLYADSSHNKDDIGSYQKCFNAIYNTDDKTNTRSIMNKIKFIFFHVPESSFCNSYLLGGCLPNVCDKKDYIKLLKYFGSKIEFIDKDCLNTVEAYQTNEKVEITKQFYIGLIPLFFSLVVVIFDFFPKLPRFLFRCCFKKKKNNASSFQSNGSSDSLHNKSESDLLVNGSSYLDSTFQDTKMSISFLKSGKVYDINGLSRLKRCFKLNSNFGELLASDISLHESKTNNESGISFTKGFRGICIILYIFGLTFQSVYQCPMKAFPEKDFSSVYLSILYFLGRFAPNMLIALSSFILCYKLLCYLDSEVERIEIKQDEDSLGEIPPIPSNKSKEISKSSPLLSSLDQLDETAPPTSSSNDNLNQLGSYLLLNSISVDSTLYQKISIKCLIKFITYQTYKYIMFISIVIFGKYSYYEINAMTDTQSPLRDFIKQSFIDKATYLDILGQIFLFHPFIPNLKDNDSGRLVFEPFNLIILEITFFIVFSILIFISYKKNWRLDIIVIALFIVQIAAKIGVFHALYIVLSKSIYTTAVPFYPSKDFIQTEWNFLRNNPFYRTGPCLIGIFFGLVNYTVQKSISLHSTRKYLTLPIKFTKFISKYQAVKLIIFTFVFLSFFIWSCFSYRVIFYLSTMNSKEIIASIFYTNYFVNVYYLVDIEILVILTFLAILPYTLIGENPIIYFLCSTYWNILSRPYFSFILLSWALVNNVLYQTDQRIGVSWNNIVHYSLINLMFGIIICDIVFAMFEMPLKKLNKLILKPRKYRKKSYDDKKMAM